MWLRTPRGGDVVDGLATLDRVRISPLCSPVGALLQRRAYCRCGCIVRRFDHDLFNCSGKAREQPRRKCIRRLLSTADSARRLLLLSKCLYKVSRVSVLACWIIV